MAAGEDPRSRAPGTAVRLSCRPARGDAAHRRLQRTGGRGGKDGQLPGAGLSGRKAPRDVDHRRLDRPHRRIARRLPRGDGAAQPAPGRQDRGDEPGAGNHPHAAGRIHRCQYDAQPRSRDADRPLLRRPRSGVRGRRKTRRRDREYGRRRNGRRLLEIRVEAQERITASTRRWGQRGSCSLCGANCGRR